MGQKDFSVLFIILRQIPQMKPKTKHIHDFDFDFDFDLDETY
jgi:hypothetical protein